MNQKLTKQELIIREALAIEAEDALQAGTLAFLSKVLVQCTLPHSKPQGNEYKRSNGLTSLTIISPSDVGIPYGTIPRLLLAWITKEAVQKKSQELILGDTLSEFMAQLGLIPTGGKYGSITALKSQFHKLLSSTISCRYNDPDSVSIEASMRVSKYHQVWWNPIEPNQASLFQSKLILSTDFFEEITKNPIPLDVRAIKALRQSPLALDLYAYLTFRNSYLRKTTTIPWEALAMQFGSDYKELRNFKTKFVHQLKNVIKIYPEARVEVDSRGLILKPSPTHVKSLPKRKIILPTNE